MNPLKFPPLGDDKKVFKLRPVVSPRKRELVCTDFQFKNPKVTPFPLTDTGDSFHGR